METSLALILIRAVAVGALSILSHRLGLGPSPGLRHQRISGRVRDLGLDLNLRTGADAGGILADRRILRMELLLQLGCLHNLQAGRSLGHIVADSSPLRGGRCRDGHEPQHGYYRYQGDHFLQHVPPPFMLWVELSLSLSQSHVKTRVERV
jgi:hypothetical protein